MKIDFSAIEASETVGFKGGEGSVSIQASDDGKVRIMRMCVHPNSSIGLHRHMGNAEVAFVVSGAGRETYEGEERELVPGNAIYCPEGHEHTIVNTGSEDLILFSVVPVAPQA